MKNSQNGLDLSLDNLQEAEEIENTFIPKSRQKTNNVNLRALPDWKLGPSLPQIRARGCAVASGPNKIHLIGFTPSSYHNP